MSILQEKGRDFEAVATLEKMLLDGRNLVEGERYVTQKCDPGQGPEECRPCEESRGHY